MLQRITKLRPKRKKQDVGAILIAHGQIISATTKQK